MDKPVVTLTFTPDGLGHGLYTDSIQLADIGRLHIRRATTIVFDDRHQYWRVRDRDGFPLYNSPSRQACLDWEREYFNRKEDNNHELRNRVGAVASGA